MTENIPEEQQEFFEHFSVTVDPGQEPVRIDKFLTGKMTNTSRTKVQLATSADCVFVNEIAVKSNYKVKPGDKITLVLPEEPQSTEIIPENIPLDIVYEDDQLIVINKAAGMVVHPGYNNYTGTLVHALAYHIQDSELFNKENLRPGLVHRIDKNTTGLLVVAKTEFALTHLAKQFYDHSSDRRYLALVWGTFDEKEGSITGYINRDIRNRKVMHNYENEDEGRWSVTHYKVLEELAYVSVVECKLETGRTHQIRAHFKHIGHTLFNDERYGGERILKGTTFTKYKQFVDNCFKVLPRQALHAKTLGFEHPTTKKWMQFDSEMPEDMQQAIEKWRNYTVHQKE